MRTFDEEIARKLKEAADAGELRLAKGYGQPAPEDPGWNSTPEALRMPMKILKDANVPPPEVELFHRRARLRQQIAECTDDAERVKLQTQLSELEQAIALRLEALRIHSTP